MIRRELFATAIPWDRSRVTAESVQSLILTREAIASPFLHKLSRQPLKGGPAGTAALIAGKVADWIGTKKSRRTMQSRQKESENLSSAELTDEDLEVDEKSYSESLDRARVYVAKIKL